MLAIISDMIIIIFKVGNAMLSGRADWNSRGTVSDGGTCLSHIEK